MKYSEYDIVDFLLDEFFIQWIKNPDQNNRHFWEKWIQEHPEKRGLVMQAASLIRSVKYGDDPEITDAMYVEIFENVIKTDSEKQRGSVSDGGNFSFFNLKNMVAVILIGFCATMVYLQMVASNETVISPPTEEVLITRTVPAGKRAIVTLADGSKVFLNAESELIYPKQQSPDQRWVQLKGEAFFEVEKEKRPFKVLTDYSEIAVLGTAFNVKEAHQELSVALVSGKVHVKDREGNQYDLAPLEMLTVDKAGKASKSGFDVLAVTGWKDRILVFQDDDLEQVIKKLEHWYGVDLDFSGEVSATWNYSGTYHNENLENVLKGISLTSGLDYRLEKGKVFLYNRNK
ncbi:FecR family protein [Cyclobacterium jeungdonense]|uniref:FecR domain-containing protein n=1 Tax=Cyclobacterium jeungdonense TaxID=708087 RepID=A0ABT8CFS9_9BACT|nr:FecR family protein [Cyclobacterium jeungdonense]MDN3690526.1 FecR domain-containing protein [Cyclobacterium jeungdonense]